MIQVALHVLYLRVYFASSLFVFTVQFAFQLLNKHVNKQKINLIDHRKQFHTESGME
jgi:hypothetical protein